jgi:hypothetical protein
MLQRFRHRFQSIPAACGMPVFLNTIRTFVAHVSSPSSRQPDDNSARPGGALYSGIGSAANGKAHGCRDLFRNPGEIRRLHIYKAARPLFSHFYKMPNKLPFKLVRFAALRHK